MFSRQITKSPLCTPEADMYFNDTIIGEPYAGDESFLSTLRALLPSRMNEDDPRINLHIFDKSYTEEQIETHGATRVLEAICCDDPIGIEGSVWVYNFCNRVPSNNKACMEVVREKFTSRYDGWQLLEKVTIFFKKSFDVVCYIDPERKRVALFCDYMNMKKWHYLQCGIFAFFPWYFNPEDGVSEKEMDLINSLRGKDADAYMECIQWFASKYDFRSARIKNLLDGFETRFDQVEFRRTVDRIENIMNEIKRLNDQIGEYIKQKSEEEIIALGLQEKISQGNGENELMEYFLHNKDLFISNVNNQGLTFQCRSYVEYFDTDEAEVLIGNSRSYFYSPYYDHDFDNIPLEDMQKLFTAIFVEQTLRIRFCSTYSLPLRGNVQGISGATYGYEFNDCMPNPHINAYSCMGETYQRVVNELLSKHDYLGAVEQCFASCKSLHITEAPTMNRFVEAFYGIRDSHINNRCIELPNGEVVNPEGAIEWLYAQEQEEEKADE